MFLKCNQLNPFCGVRRSDTECEITWLTYRSFKLIEVDAAPEPDLNFTAAGNKLNKVQKQDSFLFRTLVNHKEKITCFMHAVCMKNRSGSGKEAKDNLNKYLRYTE
jgi:hypothetical protein